MRFRRFSRPELLLLAVSAIVIIAALYTGMGYYRTNQSLSTFRDEVEAEESRLNVLRKTSNVDALRAQLAKLEAEVPQAEKGYVANVGNLEVYDLFVAAASQAKVELLAVQESPLRAEDKKLILYRVVRYGISAMGELAPLRSFVSGIEEAPFPIFAIDDVEVSPGGRGWTLSLELVVLTKVE